MQEFLGLEENSSPAPGSDSGSSVSSPEPQQNNLQINLSLFSNPNNMAAALLSNGAGFALNKSIEERETIKNSDSSNNGFLSNAALAAIAAAQFNTIHFNGQSNNNKNF